MTEQNKPTDYDVLSRELVTHQIGLSASELHGLLSGIICGGNRDSSWLTLLYDFANDGEVFSGSLLKQIQYLYQTAMIALKEDDFSFQLLMPDDDSDIFRRIDELAGWVSHFILGLGLMQPKLDKVEGDVGEVIDDLRSIALLGYDEDENKDELELSFEEVQEYVRMSAMLCFSEFATDDEEMASPILH